MDPCDRVKFILEAGEGEGEGGEGRHESHSLFTELEELRCDQHNRLGLYKWGVYIDTLIGLVSPPSHSPGTNFSIYMSIYLANFACIIKCDFTSETTQCATKTEYQLAFICG